MPKSKKTPKSGKAPTFNLKVTPDQTLSLADFAGQPVVLIFYPADFSPVCESEITLFNEFLPEFEKYGAVVAGVSVDNVWSHLAFGHQHNIGFPLLSDFEPKGETAKKYNAYREDEGICERALYLIDGNGDIAWGYVAPVGANPGVAGVLNALERLSNGMGRKFSQA